MRALLISQPDIPAGDVIFHIRHLPHSTFKPHSSSPSALAVNVKIALSEALLGFSRVMFVHLDGRGIRITSKRGERIIVTDKELVIRGEGLPIRGRGPSDRGDLFVKFVVVMPGESWAARADPEVSLPIRTCPC